MQLPIVLSHGRFATDWIIEMLRNETNYTVENQSSSCDLDKLSGMSVSERASQYMLAGNREGHRALFLFNKHLSYTGIAKHSLEQNLCKKRAQVENMLLQPR